MEKFILPNILFVIIYGVLTAYSTFLAAKGSLTNNRNGRRWLKALTKRGWTLIFVFIGILISWIWQEINNNNVKFNSNLKLKNEQKLKDSLLKAEQGLRDSLISAGIKQGVDETINKLFEDIAIAFAKQELKIDTLNNTIVNLKTEENVVNNYLTEKEPILSISTFSGIQLYEKWSPPVYRLHLESLNAGSTNFDLELFTLSEYQDGSYIFKNQVKLPANSKIITVVYIPLVIERIDKLKRIYILLRGTYTNLSGSKTYKADFLWDYDVKTKNGFDIHGSKRVKVIKEMEKFYGREVPVYF